MRKDWHELSFMDQVWPCHDLDSKTLAPQRGTKRCKKCNRDLPKVCFWIVAEEPDIFDDVCRSCIRRARRRRR